VSLPYMIGRKFSFWGWTIEGRGGGRFELYGTPHVVTGMMGQLSCSRSVFKKIKKFARTQTHFNL